MNLNRIHIEILKSPIDFKSFLKVAHGHVLYGKTTRGDPGRAQKPVKKSYKKNCNLFRVGGAHLLGARDVPVYGSRFECRAQLIKSQTVSVAH